MSQTAFGPQRICAADQRGVGRGKRHANDFVARHSRVPGNATGRLYCRLEGHSAGRGQVRRSNRGEVPRYQTPNRSTPAQH